jgi:predicted RNA-binding protein with RPS1 domain
MDIPQQLDVIRAYIQEHDLQGKVAEAVTKCVQAQPADPSAFLGKYFAEKSTVAPSLDVAALEEQAAICYAKADTDHDGSLTRNEIKKFLSGNSKLKEKMGAAEGWANLWKNIDFDNDGAISMTEWKAFYVKQMHGHGAVGHAVSAEAASNDAAPEKKMSKKEKKAAAAAKAGGGDKKKEKKGDDPEAAAKMAAKKLKAAIKEGGKKGVEIEGAADMGGLSFFCTTLMEADGDMDMLIQSFEAMNAEPPEDPEEERRGGAGGVGKMVFSAGAEYLQIVCNMPKNLQEDFVRPDGEPVREAMSAVDWVNAVLTKMSKEAPGVKAEGNADFAQATIKGDKEKGIFALKIKDDAMAYAYAILQEKNCMSLGGDSSEGACHGDFECDDY